MRPLIHWIHSLMQAEQVAPIRGLITALRADPDLVGMVPVYALAFVWLVYRLRMRCGSGRPDRLPLGMTIAGGLLRLLNAVVLLAIGLLFAVVRNAGLSTFHAGRRF